MVTGSIEIPLLPWEFHANRKKQAKNYGNEMGMHGNNKYENRYVFLSWTFPYLNFHHDS